MGTAVPEQPAEPRVLEMDFPRLPGWGPIFLSEEQGAKRRVECRKLKVESRELTAERQELTAFARASKRESLHRPEFRSCSADSVF